MPEQTLEAGPTPEVVVYCQGSLRITGWDQPKIFVRAGVEPVITAEGGQVTIQAAGDLALRVPAGSHVVVEAAHGACAVKGVAGGVHVQQAFASLAVSHTGPVQVDFAGGGLNARHIQGGLHARQLSGFAQIEDVSGTVETDFTGGHLHLRHAGGPIQARTGGNASLWLTPQPGQTYSVQAGGVLVCYVPAEASVSGTLTGGGPVTFKVGQVSEILRAQTHRFQLGSGAATLHLTAGGPVSLLERTGKDPFVAVPDFDFDFDFEGPFEGMEDFGARLSEQVTSQVEAQMGLLEAQLAQFTEQLGEAGLSAEKAERLAQKAQSRAERAREKVQRAAERTTRHIAHAQGQAARHASGGLPTHGPSWFERRGAASSGQAEPVSEDERLMVLRMLADKKITAAEAEALLAALEGRS